MIQNGVNWMGWVIILGWYGICFLGFLLLFGNAGWIWIFILTAIYIYGIINYIVMNVRKPKQEKRIKVSQEKNGTYFTDEDYMNCKIGEWVSRP